MEKFSQILKNVLIFLVIFLAIQGIFNFFKDDEEDLALNSGNLIFTTTETEYSRFQTVTLNIENFTKETITIPNECPQEPFAVFRYENNEWVQKTASPILNCESNKDIELKPGEELKIPYENWNHALFSSMGRFRIEFGTITSNEFLVVKEGIFRQLGVALFYRPIYNGLIFLASAVPGHNLGLAIILLTIVIRTILLVPSQKAMQSQRKMQEIQPRLEKIKEKYKGDQQKIAMETMAAWKEAKVNPAGSCLPILLQFPFLIALFYVIQSGLNPDKAFLLYTNYENFSIQDIIIHFLGLDLTKVNFYVLPLVVGGLQFIQMKLAMAKTKKSSTMPNEFAMASNMMVYILPVMIAVFTASLPAGVGVYWGTSTIYGIVQQVFVNRSPVSSKKDDDEPTVKVISN